MDRQRFIYVTYISTKPAQLWDALSDRKLTRQYWEHDNVSDWKRGSRWEHRRPDEKGTVDVAGKIIECEPNRRLVVTWAAPDTDEDEQGASRVTFELEPVADSVRLRLTHEGIGPEAFAGSGGWPAVLSSLKTLMETGRPLKNLW
jgi:uncharacterized protein YndB with AHSA1/START domain